MKEHIFVAKSNELACDLKNRNVKTRKKVATQVGAGFLSLIILCSFNGCGNNNDEIDDVTTTTVATLGDITTTKPQEDNPINPEDQQPSNPEDNTPTNPDDPTPPVEEVDLPGDEDGYAYPEFFRELVHEQAEKGVIADRFYKEFYAQVEPEIVYVDISQDAKLEGAGVAVFAKFDMSELVGYDKVEYVSFLFDISSEDFNKLKTSTNFNTYGEYVQMLENSVKEKNELVSVKKSAVNNLDQVNANLNDRFVWFVDNKFVDVELFYCGDVSLLDKDPYREFYGFGYDEEGKSYAFVMEVDLQVGYYPTNSELIEDIKVGEVRKGWLDRFECTVKAIDSVFEKNNANV